MPPALPDLLKEATRHLHTRAERAGAMGALLQSRLPRAGYAELLRHLHALYAALEARLEALPAAAPERRLVPAALHRASALAHDLAALGPPAAAPLVPALAGYLQRLAGATPRALVAHVYVRYLGDLNGGRVLARLVGTLYAPDAPLAFYDFGPPGRTTALRDALRADLAALPLAPGDAETLAAEARWAFEAHCRLFEELAAR